MVKRSEKIERVIKKIKEKKKELSKGRDEVEETIESLRRKYEEREREYQSNENLNVRDLRDSDLANRLDRAESRRSELTSDIHILQRALPRYGFLSEEDTLELLRKHRDDLREFGIEVPRSFQKQGKKELGKKAAEKGEEIRRKKEAKKAAKKGIKQRYEGEPKKGSLKDLQKKLTERRKEAKEAAEKGLEQKRRSPGRKSKKKAKIFWAASNRKCPPSRHLGVRNLRTR